MQRKVSFCFKLFSSDNAALSSQGLHERSSASVSLVEHGKSSCPLQASVQWFEAEQRLNKGCSFDSIQQQRISDEKLQWDHFFQRLLAIVQFLSEHKMAFRGFAHTLLT